MCSTLAEQFCRWLRQYSLAKINADFGKITAHRGVKKKKYKQSNQSESSYNPEQFF